MKNHLSERMYRGISALVASLLLVGMFKSGKVMADPSASLSKSGKAEVGKTISIKIGVSGDGPYGGYNGNIDYDSSYFEMVGIYAGNYGAANFGTGSRTFLDYNCNIASGSTIVVVELKCLQSGSTSVSVGLEVSSLDGLASYSTGASANIEISEPVVLSGNCYLSSLSVAPGSLSPSFSRDTTTYYVTVGESQSSIAVSAEPEHGGASISTNGVQNDLGKGDNTVKITVTAENGDTKTYKIIVTRGKPTPTPEPYPVIESGGNSYTILEKSSLESVPSAFSWSETTYNSKKIPCLVGPDGTLLLWLLSDDGRALYRYDLNSQVVTPCYSFTSESSSMMFMSFPNDFVCPQGYEKTTYTYNEHEIEAFKNTAADGMPMLVYLLDQEGHEGMYYLDEESGMIIPFRGDIAALIATPTPLPTDTPTPTPTPKPTYSPTPLPTAVPVEESSSGGFGLFQITTIALAVVCVALLAVLILLLINRNKDKQEIIDGGYPSPEKTPEKTPDEADEPVNEEKEPDHYYQFGDEPELRRPGAKRAGEDLDKKEDDAPVPDFPEFPERKPEPVVEPEIPLPVINVIDDKTEDQIDKLLPDHLDDHEDENDDLNDQEREGDLDKPDNDGNSEDEPGDEADSGEENESGDDKESGEDDGEV
ncbi:MAG: cadherin-like beta sandwich domain-containing protein [Clostridiales bacterium]|nr:cadherin-like beta sandwich domain-containing protein [Clostridiales bacterium]